MPASEHADFKTKLPVVSEIGGPGEGFEPVKRRSSIALFGSSRLWRKNKAVLASVVLNSQLPTSSLPRPPAVPLGRGASPPRQGTGHRAGKRPGCILVVSVSHEALKGECSRRVLPWVRWVPQTCPQEVAFKLLVWLLAGVSVQASPQKGRVWDSGSSGVGTSWPPSLINSREPPLPGVRDSRMMG